MATQREQFTTVASGAVKCRRRAAILTAVYGVIRLLRVALRRCYCCRCWPFCNGSL